MTEIAPATNSSSEWDSTSCETRDRQWKHVIEAYPFHPILSAAVCSSIVITTVTALPSKEKNLWHPTYQNQILKNRTQILYSQYTCWKMRELKNNSRDIFCKWYLKKQLFHQNTMGKKRIRDKIYAAGFYQFVYCYIQCVPKMIQSHSQTDSRINST